jgi:asparagine synthase (glutamine-hydrolysing)
MCGVLALIYPNGISPSSKQLERIVDRMAHRGPDGTGVKIDGEVGFAHRRLAIIDIVGAVQPMALSNGIKITFNGEIYNFRELRSVLIGLGHSFKYDSDTEVLLHAAEQWGPDCLSRLEGMFAIVVDDPTRGIVWAARDRMGQKPLFSFNKSFFRDIERGFVSELKCILPERNCNRVISPNGVARFLAYDFVPDSDGFFVGVQKVAPGELWIVDRDNPLIEPIRKKWYKLPFGRVEKLNEKQAMEQLDEQLDVAVQRCMVSDVPLGVFLSGGIDSSLIAAYACRHVEPSSLKTFSIGFDNPDFDESIHAQKVANHLGTKHYNLIVDSSDLLDIVPNILAAQDEPLADPSIIPTAILSRFAREEVTVALGGDGGDELFLGYPTFIAEKLLRSFRWVPNVAFSFMAELAYKYIPSGSGHYPWDYKLKRLLLGAGEPLPDRHQIWIGGAAPKLVREILLQPPDDDIFTPSQEIWKGTSGDDFERLSAVYARTYLAAGVLQKVDRASMLYGLETRSPMLESNFVEVAAQCSNSLRINGLQTKVALRNLASTMLPASIIKRPKKGFGIPLSDWLREPLSDWMNDILSVGRINRQGVVSSSVVSRLIKEHNKHSHDHGKILWNLISMSVYLDSHGG